MCDCIRLLSEALASSNTDLDIPIQINLKTGKTLPAQMLIATRKRDPKRREKAALLPANFCPTCGAKYPEETAMPPHEDLIAKLLEDRHAAQAERDRAIAQRQRLEAELRQWRGCPSYLEDHPEGTICPPHEVRTTGLDWGRSVAKMQAARAEKAETEQDKILHNLRNLLAVIHRDGGHHTQAVGLEQSVRDAHEVWGKLIERSESRDAALADTNSALAALTEVEQQRDRARATAVRLEQELAKTRRGLVTERRERPPLVIGEKDWWDVG